jgi:hypothetical protein
MGLIDLNNVCKNTIDEQIKYELQNDFSEEETQKILSNVKKAQSEFKKAQAQKGGGCDDTASKYLALALIGAFAGFIIMLIRLVWSFLHDRNGRTDEEIENLIYNAGIALVAYVESMVQCVLYRLGFQGIVQFNPEEFIRKLAHALSLMHSTENYTLAEFIQFFKDFVVNQTSALDLEFSFLTDAVCELIKRATQQAFGMGGKKRKTKKRKRKLVNKKKNRTRQLKLKLKLKR